MKSAASLLVFLCITSVILVANDFRTKVVTSTTSFSTDVPDHYHLRIFNFTQDGGTTRGVVVAAAATPTATPTPTPIPAPTPTPIQTDLTATKTDNVGGHTVFPNPWTWKIHVANGGNVSGGFASGNTILSDNLPNSTIAYGAPTVSNQTGVTGTINCSIASSNLTCTASGAVTIAPAGSFDVSFSANATATGSYANPRSGGGCSVDPINVVAERNESNNTCADTVVSGTPTPAPTPTPPPRAVLTAAIIDSGSAPEFIKQVVIDGPARITATCPDPNATCVLTYQKEPEATPTSTPTPTP